MDHIIEKACRANFLLACGVFSLLVVPKFYRTALLILYDHRTKHGVLASRLLCSTYMRDFR